VPLVALCAEWSCERLRELGGAVPSAIAALREDDCPAKALAIVEAGSACGLFDDAFASQVRAIAGAEVLVGRSATARTGDSVCDGNLQSDALVDALYFIKEKIRRRAPRVVILNESHSTQLHRAFNLRLVQMLANEHKLAIGGEAITPKIAKLLREDIPDTRSGFYTLDPVYGAIIRLAINRGIPLFAYDFPEPSVTGPVGAQRREQVQALAIAAAADTHRDRLIVILSGGEHGSRIPNKAGLRWMGALIETTHQLPTLSVDQLSGTPIVDRYYFDGKCIPASKVLLDKPSVALYKRAPLAREGFDLTVFHAVQRMRHDRPEWLTTLPNRALVRVRLKPKPTATVVRAYDGDPFGHATPVDQLPVPAFSSSVMLSIPQSSLRAVRVVRETADCKRAEIAFPRSARRRTETHR
jgi:hypothetical protein